MKILGISAFYHDSAAALIVDGKIVCSAQEAKFVKMKYKNLFVVTPGIRLPGDKKNDQSRVVTPFDAFVKNKADAIVMGRSLTKNDIKKNIQNLINHIY